jgi:hypothetical protein
VRVHFDCLAERVGQPREPTHRHPHREILAFDVARGDVLRVRIALHDSHVDADALRWAVALLVARVRAVELLQDGVIKELSRENREPFC